MAAEMAGDTRARVGRPRKHTEGWNSLNKRICISNGTFVKWRKLRDDLKLVNDDAVARYLLSAVVERSNEQTGGKSCLGTSSDEHAIFYFRRR